MLGSTNAPARRRIAWPRRLCVPAGHARRPPAEYPKLRAEFAGSRFADLRTAGTAYVDLAVALHTARGTDGYETVWFYQRLSADCAKHQR